MATVQVLYILASHIASQLLLRIIAAIFASSPLKTPEVCTWNIWQTQYILSGPDIFFISHLRLWRLLGLGSELLLSKLQ